MIISKTPLRVDLIGDGTDLPSFCKKERGSIINAAIAKYIYIIVHKSFDKKNIVAYKKREEVDNVEEIQNERVREAMKMVGITKGIEIHSLAEVPAGTGLGSSSAFTVGLLNALYAYQGKYISAERLAKEASEIEINILKDPIGRQDQYAAAFGGFNKMEFVDQEVKVKNLLFGEGLKKQIESNMMMFFLGEVRDASSILRSQSESIEKDLEVFRIMQNMRDLADKFESDLSNKDISFFGEILSKNWMLKKQLANVNNPDIEKYYQLALDAGAKGGKLSGAGGSGFLILYVEPEKQNAVRRALSDLREYEFKFEKEGSRIIYVG
jgi:D-glycero-alpha-D-manno-heptose-7-phosphate kinase